MSLILSCVDVFSTSLEPLSHRDHSSFLLQISNTPRGYLRALIQFLGLQVGVGIYLALSCLCFWVVRNSLDASRILFVSSYETEYSFMYTRRCFAFVSGVINLSSNSLVQELASSIQIDSRTSYTLLNYSNPTSNPFPPISSKSNDLKDFDLVDSIVPLRSAVLTLFTWYIYNILLSLFIHAV